ncbi:hypothetical protein-signal peptide and transmembrane prediction [Rhodopirellula baltica SH 1]|uniref:Uncharacterized protein n=1 Tax=Rhodopirellula baltica (strain DSM 10527 / NCIMB 13988 / SH1) TaxID=243090 RepID=Q7UKE0_RHOBA|nr:hypothetical protein-signal peptide and transmembrane prediction [Rhodopirellula baltica SH 1]
MAEKFNCQRSNRGMMSSPSPSGPGGRLSPFPVPAVLAVALVFMVSRAPATLLTASVTASIVSWRVGSINSSTSSAPGGSKSRSKPSALSARPAAFSSIGGNDLTLSGIRIVSQTMNNIRTKAPINRISDMNSEVTTSNLLVRKRSRSSNRCF